MHRLPPRVWLAVSLLLALLTAIHPSAALAQSPLPPQPGMRHVGPGLYKPFYPANPKRTTVPLRGFWLDTLPVTNQQFLMFVKAQPSWQRGEHPSDGHSCRAGQ